MPMLMRCVTTVMWIAVPALPMGFWGGVFGDVFGAGFKIGAMIGGGIGLVIGAFFIFGGGFFRRRGWTTYQTTTYQTPEATYQTTTYQTSEATYRTATYQTHEVTNERPDDRPRLPAARSLARQDRSRR
jgi:hypothetical protein